MKKQIIVINGGNAFNTYEEYLAFLKDREIDFEEYRNHRKDWKATLDEKLGKEFEVVLPTLPNKMNAKYLEWKIWFEKFIPYFEPEVVLIGHSLGGTFLAKYLSENKFPKTIRATFLVAPPYDYEAEAKENYLADFALPKDLSKLTEQGGKIFIYQSKDDPLVPFVDSEKYKRALPTAETMIFEDKGHFRQTEFPELISNIKKIYN
jgi:hypothetical protein